MCKRRKIFQQSCRHILEIYYYFGTEFVLLNATAREISDVLHNVLDLTVVSSSSNLALRYAFFVPEMSANFTSYIVQNIYIALAWILYPLHFSLLPLIQKT